ncbi:MAG: hypothetical protein Q9M97_03350 [Candidatus Gracilibacteria bacterium]|nr:hypothetical protein [Candidatus Gracilibacteria bacterium]
MAELNHLIIDGLKYGKRSDRKFSSHQIELKSIIDHIFKDTNKGERKYTELDTEVFEKLV